MDHFKIDEIRGEIWFMLYKLSLLNTSPWDNICDNDNLNRTVVRKSLVQLSLEVLLNTQNDVVRLNCIGDSVLFHQLPILFDDATWSYNYCWILVVQFMLSQRSVFKHQSWDKILVDARDHTKIKLLNGMYL